MSFSPRQKRILWALVILISIALIIVVFHKPILTKAATTLIVRSELSPSDLIVIISGGLPEIYHGIDLYNQGYGEKILFLGHYPVTLAVISEEPLDVALLNWDKVAAHMAVQTGVPEDALLFSDAFTNSTYERAQAFINVAQENNIQSMIVVCDEIHSLRLSNSVRQILADVNVVVHYAPVPQEYYLPAYQFDPESWWQDESNIKSVFEEYLKLAYYAIKY